MVVMEDFGIEMADGDVGGEYDRVHWTVIKIPLWDVVAFVLSTELGLTVVTLCVDSFPSLIFSKSHCGKYSIDKI